MFPQKCEEIVAGAGVYLEKPANVMSRVDSFSFRLGHGIVIEI